MKVRLRRVLWIVIVLLLWGCTDSSLHLQSGDRLSWDSLRGRWVFVNYWAEWCQPCRVEIPELNHFAQNHQREVVVLGVNLDQPNDEELARQIRAMEIEFPTLSQDPSQLLGFERPTVLPATYVFDPQGDLQGVLLGPQTEHSLLAEIRLDHSNNN